VGVRFPESTIETIDAWAAKAGDDVSRSEAIRRLVERGLTIPAIFRSDIREIANGSGSARDRMAEARKRTEFYKRMSIEFHREDFERVESDLQSLDDSLKVTGASARVLQVIEHARGYLKESVEEMRLKAKAKVR
jgi:Arc/MetJ-type ribon-helix-helix transcriptional regulator